jgi:DNA-binding GntR family transcriptional regulator
MPKNALPLPARSSRRQQLPEEVASYVRELIVSGKVHPGAFLRIEPIAEAVGVSNTPVREGLLLLRSEGFVKFVPRRGFMVASFTAQDIRDIFWVQAQLAGELAARAAKNITPVQVESLERIIEQYDKATDDELLADLGHAFHREVNLAAGSYRLALLLGAVVKQLPNRFYATIDGMVSASRDDHPELVGTLRKRQPRKARSLMERHILERADHLATMFEERETKGTAFGA